MRSFALAAIARISGTTFRCADHCVMDPKPPPYPDISRWNRPAPSPPLQSVNRGQCRVHLPYTTPPEDPSAFDQWCRMTAWHGIHDFHITNSNWVKALWVVVIFVCTLISANQCISLLMDYTSSKEKWISSVRFESVPDDSLEWPNLKVCSPNAIPSSALTKTGNHDPYGIAYMQRPDPDSLDFYDRYLADQSVFIDGYTAEKMQAELNEEFKSRVQNESMKKITSWVTIECNKTAIHCGQSASFDLRKSPRGVCCDQETAFMACFYINSSRAEFGKSLKLGRASSVYFLFHPRSSDYYQNLLLYRVPTDGLLLQLFYGNPDLANHVELALAPGTHIMVSLVRQKHRTTIRKISSLELNFVYKPCNETFNYTFFDHSGYSAKLCVTDCALQAFQSVCSCSINLAPYIRLKPLAKPLCYGFDVIQCHMNITRVLQFQSATTLTNEKLLNCTRDCNEACEYDTLDIHSSNAGFPAPNTVASFTTYLNRVYNERYTDLNFTEDDTRGLIFFEMFYEAKQTKVIERVNRITVAELISNIGGTLGVWSGLSVLSIFQCMVYSVKGLSASLRRRRRHRIAMIRVRT